ncbi:4640_t:CDS:2 [Diversispora eburnea]|uniref:4640_t:CDS:1 n=1 Tax=Diversispora eburnea TaxID=1213867 RepID=A0A9N8W8F3_9GLOM|nr:4640_t:CDS:2 [Diversispora eburnea]
MLKKLKKLLKQGLNVKLSNELWIIIFTIYLEESNFRKIFQLRRTCKQWNNVIPIVVNTMISRNWNEEWEIRIMSEDESYIDVKFVTGIPYYDDFTNLVCFINPVQSFLIDFSRNYVFTFTLFCNEQKVTETEHYIDVMGESVGEKVYCDLNNSFYCIGTLEEEYFDFIYWKVSPKQVFEKMDKLFEKSKLLGY